MENNLSPEERLFHAIKNNDDKIGKSKNFLQQSLLKTKKILHLARLPQAVLSGNFSVVLRNINLGSVSRALGIVFLVITLIVIHHLIFNRVNIARIVERISKINFAGNVKRDIEKFPPLYVYTDLAHKRDLFRPTGRIEQTTVRANLNEEFKTLIKDIKVVGIYWGQAPEVMLEDTVAGKTYFLSKESLIKGIKIKEIYQDRILLEYKGQEMELM